MIHDEEFEELVLTPERIKFLGFKPQKETLTNHLLPYASELDKESATFLEQVKTNLAKSVMLREMKPSCGVWSSRLMKYIRIYGLKFGKEDHIALIKLAYELILIPDLEPCKVHKFAIMFLMLIKKRNLIRRDELTLPWRPLYEMGKKMFNSNETALGMYHYPGQNLKKLGVNIHEMIRKLMSGYGLDGAHGLFGFVRQGKEFPTSLEGSYVSLITCAKPYFDLNATKEMLEEFLPQILPWSSDAHLITQMALFLPDSLSPDQAEFGHKLWFDKLIELWDTCYNPLCGVYDLIVLFASLAKRSPGAVDWTPHVPKMFMFILHSLNLPVSYKEMQCNKNYSLDMKHVSIWIVWNINPDGVVLKHLQSFLAGIESYLHTANSGRWSFKLRDLLKKLSKEFLHRVRKEREKKLKGSWENRTPEAYKLRDEDLTEFVKMMLEPTLQAVYNRNGSLDVLVALQNLAILRPAIVIPPLLEKLRTSLTSLTEPHRVTAAMAAVAAVARPMLRGADVDYPEGPTHVVPFLLAVLPGLDPNDIKKTLVSLNSILIFSTMVPYIDCSSAHEYWPDLTEEELLVCESTAQMEDFVLVFLDRLFIIIESSAMEQVRLDTKECDGIKSKTDAAMETALSSAATSVLMQCSPKIFKEALRKFKSFATDSTFETNVSGSMVGVLLRVFARIDAESTLAAFLPQLCTELKELLSTDESLHDENPSRDVVYRLVLLLNIVQCDGKVLLKYMTEVVPVLDKILKLHAKFPVTRGCEVLSGILFSLSNIEIVEARSSSKDYGEAPKTWLPIREWGRGCLIKDANLKWHVPDAEEAACAQMLIDRYLMHEVQRLRQWVRGERPMCRDRKLRSFYIINATLSASTFLPPCDEKPVVLVQSQVPATSMPFTNGVRYTVTLEGKNLRAVLTELLLDVQSTMLAANTDETRGLEMLTQLWERVVVIKAARSIIGLETRLRSYGALERALDGRGSPAGVTMGTKIRTLLADAAKIQDISRLDFVCDAGITPAALKALHALYDLSINTYSSVRMLAQIRLYWMLNHYPYSYSALLPKLINLLETGGEGDEWHAKHKGALFIILGPRTAPLLAKQDWHVVRSLWLAVLRAPLSEKPSIIKLEQGFGEAVHRAFPTVNTRLIVPQSTIDAAASILTENQINEPEFAKAFSNAVQFETELSDKMEDAYKDFLEKLVDIISSPNVPWRRIELAMQMFTSCSSLQTPYPPKVVHFLVHALIHDDVTVRRAALRLVAFCLKQQKRKIIKIGVDPYEIAGVPKPDVHVPGYRKDIEWAMWQKDYAPQTDEEWDKPWLKNTSYGFYAWPKLLKVAAPSREQYCFTEMKVEDMEEGERYLFEFFHNDDNIDRLVAFLTVEEKRGKEKFNGVRFTIFKLLFSQFGERIAGKMLGHALKCASDPQEAPQRLAAEMASAALVAPRYWPRERALALQRTALGVIKAGLTAVTVETIEDWGTCLATGADKLDPRRSGEIFTALLDFCAPESADGSADDQEASFVVCARLIALQGALGTLTWRGAPLAAELLKRLESTNFIQHPYQNVRETVGSMLMTIFDKELVFPGGDSGPAPRLADFLESVRPRLAALYDEHGDIVVKSVATATMSCSTQAGSIGTLPTRAALLSALSHAHVTTSQHTAQPHDEAPQPSSSTAGQGEGEADEAESESALIDERLENQLDKQLELQLQASLRLAGDAAPSPPFAPKDHANAVNLLTTVLRGCMGLVVRGVRCHVDAQYRIAGVACAAAARGPLQPHEELGRAAGGLLAGLACARHPPATFDAALMSLHTLSTARSWWARLACVELAQPLLFYGLPMLCDRAESANQAEQFALMLMRDKRLEVRQTAAKLLTGLMHCRALPDEDGTLRALLRSCRSQDLLEKHCGVLGLCGYIASRPYSLAPKLGDVLTELARHTSAPDPIPATIRSSLADFRRTHQDDWAKHREQLTEEELDLLSDLTSPPSYCA